MSTASAIICGCCRVEVTTAVATFDGELDAHVCPECRVGLRDAKAQLARPFDGGNRIINIKGCYRASDAPDNS